MNKEQDKIKYLGAGKSGKVFLVEIQGQEIARKIFTGNSTAHFIHYIFSGAPNPYSWNEDAIAAACYRRKILHLLLPLWFENVQVANAFGWGWNDELQAFYLDTEFVKGRLPKLINPFEEGREEYKLLVFEVMKPLQEILIASGFHGLVWQAGKGNPVALNNFLLVGGNKPSEISFYAIDVESGVPALFPLNFLELFRFYLPKSVEFGNVLFDDVDIEQLIAYLQDLEFYADELPAGKARQLEYLVKHLKVHQYNWKSKSWVNNSIDYHLKANKISPSRAEFYLKLRGLWVFRMVFKLVTKAIRKLLIRFPRWVFLKLIRFPYLEWLKKGFRFAVSRAYRLQSIRNIVKRRIEHWQDRGQLSKSQAGQLKAGLHQDVVGDHLNGFSVHIGIKAISKVIEFTLIPFLLVAGVISEGFAVIWFVAGGPVYRTVYTVFRMLQMKAEGKKMPWMAFFIGMLPTVGDVAFPAQIIYDAGAMQNLLARFIVYDSITLLGSKFPVWGGEDTRTEHFFNNMAHKSIYCIGLMKKKLRA